MKAKTLNRIKRNLMWTEKPFDKVHAWMDLIDNGNMSVRDLATRWGWSRTAAWDFIKKLHDNGHIDKDDNGIILTSETTVPKKIQIKPWRESFEVYLAELRKAVEDLNRNEDFMKKQKSNYPKIDVWKSMNKACKNYWAREVGWERKKSSRSVDIDWEQTMINALTMRSNHFYKNDLL